MTDARKILAKAIHPEVWSTHETVAHLAASPRSVDAAQRDCLLQADDIILSLKQAGLEIRPAGGEVEIKALEAENERLKRAIVFGRDELRHAEVLPAVASFLNDALTDTQGGTSS